MSMTTTASFMVVKEKGLVTGRVSEKIRVNINAEDGTFPSFAVEYGSNWGFTHNGKRYSFKSGKGSKKADIYLVHPDSGAEVKLPKRLALFIDLDTFETVK